MELINENDGRVIITPTEESITDEEAMIRDAAITLLKKGNNRIVFDLSHVKYIGDSGMSLLLRIHREASARGGDVGIIGLRPELKKVFELTRLDRIFELSPGSMASIAGKADQ